MNDKEIKKVQRIKEKNRKKGNKKFNETISEIKDQYTTLRKKFN